jgi:type IV secretory pathway TrbD component
VNDLRKNKVYKSINAPLLILGVERRLFWISVILGVGFFNGFNSPLGGIVLFLAGMIFGRWATRTDPEILKLFFNAEKFKTQYSSIKFKPILVRRIKDEKTYKYI